MKDTWLNTGFGYHMARCSWVGLDVTLKNMGSKIRGIQDRLECHPGSRPRTEFGGRFPIGKLTDACTWPVASL